MFPDHIVTRSDSHDLIFQPYVYFGEEYKLSYVEVCTERGINL